MINAFAAAANGATKGPGWSSTPDARQRDKKKKEPLAIENLNAWSLRQVQQSLDKYNKSLEPKKGPSWGGRDGINSSNRDSRAQGFGNYDDDREQFRKGKYDIEDEYRYMQNNGFVGKGYGMDMGIGPDGNPVQQPSEPVGMKPGDKGYNYTPQNNYYGTAGSPQGMQGTQAGRPPGNYDYSGYNAAAIGQGVKNSGNITTKFYNSGYGASVEQGESQFGHADLEGNLAAGITAKELKTWFDNGNSNTLGAKQQQGMGGIYDQVAAAADAEEKIALDALPTPSAPPPMRIPGATVGNAGNASGVRAKRSNSSRSGRNARGTSQFNRRSFGNQKASPLTIGGLNI